MPIKLNPEKHEEKLKFLDERLYPARNAVNNALREAGLKYAETSILWDVISIIEDYPESPIPVAHRVIVMYDVTSDQTLFGQLRLAVTKLNELFVEASRLNVETVVNQDVDLLDALPEDIELEEYNGRFALVIKVSSPNLDDELLPLEIEQEDEEV